MSDRDLSEIGQLFLAGGLTERGIRSLELIADALQTLAKVESERLTREYPPERSPRATQINRASDDKREQYSDKASEEWLKQTEAAIPIPKSRFEERLESERKRSETSAQK
jgi:hypothetical protein